MKVLAFLTDPEIVQKILRHVKLPDRPPPLTPARLPVDLFYPEDGGWTGEEVATVGEGMGGVCSWPAEP